MKEQIKPELNNESKARFFAQYYGQFVAVQFGTRDTYDITYHTLNSIGYDYLKLKSLLSITDEDAAKITIYSEYSKGKFNESGYITPKGFKCYSGISCDFLRSKGYALPWMGLSVEQMIQAGWIRLKQQ